MVGLSSRGRACDNIPVGIHLWIHFGKRGHDLHTVGNFARRAKRHSFQSGFHGHVVEIRADVSIVWHLVEIEILFDLTDSFPANLKAQLNQFSRHARLIDNPAKTIQTTDHIIDRMEI